MNMYQNLYGGQTPQNLRSFISDMDILCSGHKTTKNKKHCPGCYQKYKNTKARHYCDSVGSYHISADGEAHLHAVCCLQDKIFFSKVHTFFNKTMENHILHTLRRHNISAVRIGQKNNRNVSSVPKVLLEGMAAFQSGKSFFLRVAGLKFNDMCILANQIKLARQNMKCI